MLEAADRLGHRTVDQVGSDSGRRRVPTNNTRSGVIERTTADSGHSHQNPDPEAEADDHCRVEARGRHVIATEGVGESVLNLYAEAVTRKDRASGWETETGDEKTEKR